MAVATMTVADFLLARIAEDEHYVKSDMECHEAFTLAPERMLADCEAKRKIVALHVVGDPTDWDPALWACRLCQWDEDCDSPKQDTQYGAGRFPCSTLTALAAVYADHPDYRDEWRA